MIILVEINVKGFLWKCAKKTSIYGQNHKVANSERYWTLLTKEKTLRCNLTSVTTHPLFTSIRDSMLIDTSLHQISLISCVKEYKYLPGKLSPTK